VSNEEIDEQNKANGTRKSKTARIPELPTSDELKAMVRRVLWTVDYQRNCLFEIDDAPHCQNPVASIRGKSIYGYELNENGRCVEAGEVFTIVDQPFMTRVHRQIEPQAKHASAGSDKRPASASLLESQSNKTRTPHSANPRRGRKRSSEEIWHDVANEFRQGLPFGTTARDLDMAVDEPYGTHLTASCKLARGPDVRHSV